MPSFAGSRSSTGPSGWEADRAEAPGRNSLQDISTGRSLPPAPACPEWFASVNEMDQAVLQVLAIDDADAERCVLKDDAGLRGLQGELKALMQGNRDMASRLVRTAAGGAGVRAAREGLESQLAVVEVEGSELEEQLRAAMARRDAMRGGAGKESEGLRPRLQLLVDAAGDKLDQRRSELEGGVGVPTGEKKAWVQEVCN